MAKFTKKKKIALAMAALVLGTGGAAFAYWTAGGSGTGEATTATTTSTLTAVQTSTVTASISSVTKAAGAPAGTCDATDYALAGATMTVGHEVAAGSGVDAWTGATLKFNNKATAQDACKGATVNLAYTIA